MNEELQLKLQAYLDGELPSGEAKVVRDLLARDAAARDLLAELTHTRDALAGHEAAIKLPESREFYWSKIQRQIAREPKTEIRARGFSLSAWLRRVLVPAGAIAAVAIAAMWSLPRAGDRAGDYSSTSGETATFTYQNYATGTTLVWLDYSAENDFSEADWDAILDL
jgi:anti-sigma factor RsiW